MRRVRHHDSHSTGEITAAAVLRPALIWGAACVAMAVARHTRLTPLLDCLAIDVDMVNVRWLAHEPDGIIEGFAEIGVSSIMIALSFEEDRGNCLTSIRRGRGIAFSAPSRRSTSPATWPAFKAASRAKRRATCS
jgi:hypothetical protein